MIAPVILLFLFTVGFAGTRFVYRPEMREHFGPGLWLSATACLAAGFVLNRIELYLAVVFLAFVTTVSTRRDVLCRCVILCAVLPNPVWGAGVTGAYFFDLSVVGVLMLAALVVLLSRGRRDERPVRGFQVGDALAIAIVLIFGFLYSRDFTPTGGPRTFVTTLFALVLPYLVIRRAVRTPDDLRRVIAAFAGAAMILAVVALYETVNGWSLYEGIRRNLVAIDFTSPNARVRGGFLRAPTAFLESTSFAVFQMIGVLAAIASRPVFRSRALWLGGVSLTVLGLLTAQSRGADLGLLVGIAALLLFNRRFGLVAAFAGIAGIGVGALLVAAQTNQRAASFVGSSQTYGEFHDYRGFLLSRGIEEGMKNPLFGDSIGHVIARMPDVVQGEHIVDLVNSYLTIFMASGLVGLTAFVTLLAALMVKLWAASRPGRADLERAPLLVFAGGAFAGLAVALLFTAFWERNPLWLLVLLACTRPLLAARRQAFRPAAPRATPRRTGSFAGSTVATHA